MLMTVAGMNSFPETIDSKDKALDERIGNTRQTAQVNPTNRKSRASGLTVVDNGLRVVVLELLLDLFQISALQSPQKDKDEHCKDGSLDELVDDDFDNVRLGKWIVRRGRYLAIEKQVVEMVPRSLQN